jgi:outer membrane protein OmpA-like peptidoglycan-associated protein
MHSGVAKLSLPLLVAFAIAPWLAAQEQNPTQSSPTLQDQTTVTSNPGAQNGEPLYKITVVGRDIPAINYFHRQGSTKIGFQGTSLLPAAHGEAKVDARLGRTVIDAQIERLDPANSFGPEYLTYVLWAITPEGRPVNLGEILPSGSKDKSNITVTTDLQAFGLIVTAEPYYAVTMPSDLVVAQNYVLEDKTQGVIEPVNAHYSLLPRGAYEQTAGRHSVLHPITRDESSPLELYEAMNAVQIAESGGAAQYAPDSLANAKTALQNARDIDSRQDDRKQTITYAREAVQAAEDARIITIRKIQAEDEANAKRERDEAQQQAQVAQQQADQAQQNAQQQAEQRAEADREAEKAREAQQQAELARQQAEQAQQQAVQREAEIREQLRQQLSAVLQTRETARGLIMNMSDVLFDFNKYSLKPEAREKLAKISGILLAYPGLKMQVEGYTDNIGTDEYNQKLSEERAGAVRDYLVSQSVTDNSVSAQGFGKNNPIADNSTNAGRAQNRRVELVVSGAPIGIQQQPPGAQGADGGGMNGGSQRPTPQDSAERMGTSNPPQQ